MISAYLCLEHTQTSVRLPSLCFAEGETRLLDLNGWRSGGKCGFRTPRVSLVVSKWGTIFKHLHCWENDVFRPSPIDLLFVCIFTPLIFEHPIFEQKSTGPDRYCLKNWIFGSPGSRICPSLGEGHRDQNSWPLGERDDSPADSCFPFFSKNPVSIYQFHRLRLNKLFYMMDFFLHPLHSWWFPSYKPSFGSGKCSML